MNVDQIALELYVYTDLICRTCKSPRGSVEFVPPVFRKSSAASASRSWSPVIAQRRNDENILFELPPGLHENKLLENIVIFITNFVIDVNRRCFRHLFARIVFSSLDLVYG